MIELPEDVLFTAEHEWVRIDSSTVARIGVTAYATGELGDIVYVSLPTVGSSVVAGDSCGELESTKSVADIFAPVSGVVVRINETVADEPELIGQDPFGEGWLFDVELADTSELDDLLDEDAYAEHIGE
ncbi:Glycine cleavage system H protein [bioreactor metagenome]|jgi:glycine cleavage system H protein|uniref:Glycine cleavage system H protein n=2 Tax=root TaxID=1 RepID=A0AAN0ME79_9ACTN|nr:glycine cleavage system protein GcvH [Brooklawnia sp. SH051]MCB0884794.1 glycine cleavage system protein GcvH [Propionibacteriaceae bacterium]MEA5121075.1 glycine cleavage system protein GcvH [Propionibacterium sp.]NLI86601.1 glycine cleavage system protein GcvH [Propionibacterium sp.]BEH00837.1 glycine cleavage system protein GcvH [Brooklawnia sp. SH051]